MVNEIKRMKKIELHLHLDGSVSPHLASKLSGLTILECKKRMQANLDNFDLGEYLTKFDFPISLMQTEKNLEIIALDLVKRLEKENIIYAEIRFAPSCHLKEGLTYDLVIESVLKGLRKNKKVKTNLILCMKRESSYDENLEIIELASKYLHKGVCAIDLAGDEKKYPLTKYVKLFKIANQKGIPFTIHAGEVTLKDLKTAIKLGTKRIGHGVKCIDDKEIYNLIKEKNILLEICPTSNIQTKGFLKYSEHPIYDFYKNNINISISTDNMTVSNIKLEDEYMNILKTFPMSIDDLKKININSINYTFLTTKEKIELLDEISK